MPRRDAAGHGRQLFMTEDAAPAGESTGGNAAALVGGRAPLFSLLESSALIIAGFTLPLLYHGLLEMAARTGVTMGAVWMLLPHIMLIAAIIAGFRRLMTILAGVILLAACFVGLTACLDVLAQRHDSVGLEFAAVLQLPLFILRFRIGREPFSLSELAWRWPRIALGMAIGAAGWYLAGSAVRHAGGS